MLPCKVAENGIKLYGGKIKLMNVHLCMNFDIYIGNSFFKVLFKERLAIYQVLSLTVLPREI
jgi:hypothetical protein